MELKTLGLFVWGFFVVQSICTDLSAQFPGKSFAVGMCQKTSLMGTQAESFLTLF